MRILTYKRTHTGDPNENGCFGINNCMGSVRNWSFDAVIGVGGYGAEPKSHGIDGRVTWVGVNPSRSPHPEGDGQIVTFESFRLLDANGPPLDLMAPLLARRMEKGARVLLNSYSPAEKAEAEALIVAILGLNSNAKAKSSTNRCQKKPRELKACR